MMEQDTNPIEITILITAHNEADRIESCLRWLILQDFPMERVETLVIDDRSDDGTGDLVRRMSIPRLRILRIDDRPQSLTSRQAALDLGFREAHGEIVMVADAGGRLPREWIRELSGELSYRDGAATSPVLFAGHPRFFSMFQSLHSLVGFSLCRWANANGFFSGLFGTNMAVRRDAYFETGGFPAIGFAAAESMALGMGLKRAGWNLRLLTAPIVQNQGSENIHDIYHRERRRLLSEPPAVHHVRRILSVTNLLLILMAILAGGLWPFLLFLRYIIGCAILTFSVGQFGSLKLLKWVYIYEPMAMVLDLAAGLGNLLRPHWQWGGITYDRGGPIGEVKSAETPANAPEDASPAGPETQRP